MNTVAAQQTSATPRLHFDGLDDMSQASQFVDSSAHAKLRSGWARARSRFQFNAVRDIMPAHESAAVASDPAKGTPFVLHFSVATSTAAQRGPQAAAAAA